MEDIFSTFEKFIPLTSLKLWSTCTDKSEILRLKYPQKLLRIKGMVFMISIFVQQSEGKRDY